MSKVIITPQVTSVIGTAPITPVAATNGAVTVAITGASTSAAGSMAAADVQKLTKQAVTGGTVTIDWTAGLTYELTSNANVAITMTNPIAGQWHAVVIHYGGAHTVTFTTTVNWPGAVTPTWTSTNGTTDIVYLFYTTGTNYCGDASLNYAVAS